MDPLTDTLRQLEAALKKSYPRRLAGLAQPASPKSLKALEKAAGRGLPEELVALYAWRGGGAGFLTDRDTDDSSPGWDWSPPDAAAADHRIWSKLRPKGWSPNLLPIFSNGAGDNVCLDAATGKLVGLFHEAPGEQTAIAKSLAEAMRYVLSRVKAGTWNGAPEGKEVSRILGKLEKGGDLHALFGNDIFRLLQKDPRATLTVLAFAESHQVPAAMVQEVRAQALLVLGDVEGAYRALRSYLQAVIAQGSIYNPPFVFLRGKFAKAKKPAYEFALAEVTAMHQAHLLDAWLAAGMPKADRKEALRDVVESADSAIQGTGPEEELRGWMKLGMSEADARKKVKALVASGALAALKGDELARTHAARAVALQGLGKAAGAKESWRSAAKASARVAKFWQAFPEI